MGRRPTAKTRPCWKGDKAADRADGREPRGGGEEKGGKRGRHTAKATGNGPRSETPSQRGGHRRGERKEVGSGTKKGER